MSGAIGSVWAAWSGNVPVLPQPAVMHWGLQLGWSVVLACLGLWWVRRWARRRGVPLWPVALVFPMALAASAFLPGQAASSYWLGLAFQAPSVSTVVLAMVWLVTQWRQGGAGAPGIGATGALQAGVGGRICGVEPDLVLAAMGVVLGWALLLDTFALLPVSLYGWGFHPAAPLVALLAGLLPWVLWGGARRGVLGATVCATAVTLFVMLNLPRGNLWDALLDPWLWLVLHGVFWRTAWYCYENRSCLRLPDAR